MHGKGKYTFDNGSVYEGDYQDDKRHGHGNIRFANGHMYEGYWENDKMHGKGKYTFDDGSVYEGHLENDKIHGKGTLSWANGNVYKGNWKKGLRHGYGVMTYKIALAQEKAIPSGSTYDGYWENDKMHTQGNELGKLTWPPHDSDYPDKSTPCGLRSFQGQWQKGIPQISRGDNVSPMSLENWGNYKWKRGDSTLLDQERASAWEIHQKSKKMQKKLGPVLQELKLELNGTDDHDPEFIEALIEKKDVETEIISKIYTSVKERLEQYSDLNNAQIANAERVLNRIGTSSYIKVKNNKDIILTCFLYAVNTNLHEPDFILYYINTFIEDNISAYDGDNGISCTKGILERFFTVLESTLTLALASGNDSFLGKDEAKREERRNTYEKILNLWGRNKPDMANILASFDATEDRSMLKDKSRDEKIRMLIDFIKSKYIEADQDISTVEDDFDNYLTNNNISRTFLFSDENPDYIIGGRRKTTRRRKTKATTRKKGKK